MTTYDFNGDKVNGQALKLVYQSFDRPINRFLAYCAFKNFHYTQAVGILNTG